MKMALPVSRAVRMSIALARLLALAVFIIAALVLAGWTVDLSGIGGRVPELRVLAPNAAVALIGASVGLFCLTVRVLRPLSWLIGLALVLFGIASLGQLLYGLNLRFDDALLRVLPARTPVTPAQSLVVAPGMLTSLILFGLALLSAKSNRFGSGFSQLLAIAMLAQVLIIIAGQLYGVATFDYPFPFTAMSAASAAAIPATAAQTASAPVFTEAEKVMGHRFRAEKTDFTARMLCDGPAIAVTKAQQPGEFELV